VQGGESLLVGQTDLVTDSRSRIPEMSPVKRSIVKLLTTITIHERMLPDSYARSSA
jgi:hypothetical protein